MIETPRLVKRLGPDGIEHKRVETASDLATALAAGWRVSLADVEAGVATPAPPPDEPPPVVEDIYSAAQDDAETADEAPEGAETETVPEPATDKPKRGRPRR